VDEDPPELETIVDKLIRSLLDPRRLHRGYEESTVCAAFARGMAIGDKSGRSGRAWYCVNVAVDSAQRLDRSD